MAGCGSCGQSYLPPLTGHGNHGQPYLPPMAGCACTRQDVAVMGSHTCHQWQDVPTTENRSREYLVRTEKEWITVCNRMMAYNYISRFNFEIILYECNDGT